jgi:hypothetical protein
MAFEFNNPLLFELRSGTSDSPYISKQDSRLIVNNQITLDEIPDELTAVTITLTGKAQAGASTSITLASSASATNDIYNNYTITITSGTGAGQSKIITDYVGDTKVATVSTWTTNPDATSVYSINYYNESKTITGLASNSFYVNYTNGLITFNSTENGNTVLASYMGRGIIQYPAERIYCTNENNDTIETLQDIIDDGRQTMLDTIDQIYQSYRDIQMTLAMGGML